METDTEKEKPSRNSKGSWIDRLATRRGMIYLACISLALLILTGLGAWYFFQSGAWVKITDLKLTPPPSLDDLATQYPELGTILQDPKLDSVYKDFLVAYQEGGQEAAYDLARKRGLVNERDELRMTLILDTTESDAIVAELEASGVIVTTASSNLIDIIIPPSVFQAVMQSGDASEFLESLSGLEHVIKIRLPIPDIQGSHPGMGSMGGESLPVINAKAWHKAGFTGKGMKVAILDYGFDKYQSMLGTKLPDHVMTRSFIYGKEIANTGIVHGTACAEIVHDVAPDAELYLAAYDTQAEWFQAVDWLASQGVNIISHSGGTSVGSLDGNENQALKVDELAESGIVWVNSMANDAQIHYRGVFTDQDGDGYHEFAPGDETIKFYSSGWMKIILNWDAWDTGDQDFNLYLLDSNYNEIASSENVQNGSEKDASEVIPYDPPYKGTFYASIYAKNVTRPAVLDFFAGYADKMEYPVPEHSLCVPGDARRALAVGATNWKDDILEKFSSRGPTTDGRIKPELTAPDRVSSAAFGGAFFGTSASTPHVAGAAALVRQAYPNFTVQQVIEFLESRAVDLGSSGPDNAYGYGRLWLGEPPSEVAMLPPGPTQTLPTEPPKATYTSSSATLTPQKTATKTPYPTSTPKPGSGDSEANLQTLAFLGLVILPGMFSLGGIGLLGGIWYRRRSKSAAKHDQEWYPVSPKADPERPPEPWIQRQSEVRKQKEVTPALPEKNVCRRCGKPYSPPGRFCTTCGFALQISPGNLPELKPRSIVQQPKTAAYCTYCGHKLRPNSKFCTRCGKAQ